MWSMPAQWTPSRDFSTDTVCRNVSCLMFEDYQWSVTRPLAYRRLKMMMMMMMMMNIETELRKIQSVDRTPRKAIPPLTTPDKHKTILQASSTQANRKKRQKTPEWKIIITVLTLNTNLDNRLLKQEILGADTILSGNLFQVFIMRLHLCQTNVLWW